MSLLKRLAEPGMFRVWIVLWLVVLTFEVYDIVDVDISVNADVAPIRSWIELNYQLVLSLVSLAGAAATSLNGGKGRRRKMDTILDDVEATQPVTMTAAQLMETVELVLRSTAKRGVRARGTR